MAILSDYEEEDQKKPTPSGSASSSSVAKHFNSVLDPSNPLGFLEAALEFLAKESDLFKSDYLVKDVNAVVRQVKDRVEAEERKRKEKAEGNAKAEKKIKEEKPKEGVEEAAVAAGEKINDAKQEEKDENDNNKGLRGSFSCLIAYYLRLHQILLLLNYDFRFCYKLLGGH